MKKVGKVGLGRVGIVVKGDRVSGNVMLYDIICCYMI